MTDSSKQYVVSQEWTYDWEWSSEGKEKTNYDDETIGGNPK